MPLRKYLFLVIVAAIGILFVLNGIPLVLALLTALVLEPIITFLERSLRMNRVVAASATLLIFLALVGVAGYWIGTKLVVQGVELAHRLPALSTQVFEMVEQYIWMFQDIYFTLPADTIQQVLSLLKTQAVNAASAVAQAIIAGVAAIPSLLIVFLVYLIALFLFSLDLPRVVNGFMSIFSDSAREKVDLVLRELNRATIGFLRAQIILSLMTYVLTLIGLLILQVKYAVVIAFLVMLVDILPILGTGSFLVPWAAYSFYQGDAHLAGGLLIMFVLITVIRRTIEPKILGTSLGISALSALISLYIGFQLLGFIGLILGPAVVIIFEALRKAGFLHVKIDF
ncbi:sporulation integral membrane protein YtvI [Brevibacillus humidisoli]|uniref:sporulation integral membrane protein YtvI n=1 Tax=Brevibacillus humidisoli TaxID=2895522 RepID=UPI001E4682AC|nr:sporulation integral membrane protein YtvI [Brevibacillus humidisoli]UFJ41494.1 sporulation integral membrane protein YtvI [Brevibacillus humidisoli]